MHNACPDSSSIAASRGAASLPSGGRWDPQRLTTQLGRDLWAVATATARWPEAAVQRLLGPPPPLEGCGQTPGLGPPLPPDQGMLGPVGWRVGWWLCRTVCCGLLLPGALLGVGVGLWHAAAGASPPPSQEATSRPL